VINKLVEEEQKDIGFGDFGWDYTMIDRTKDAKRRY
jgi:hypothetical protein